MPSFDIVSRTDVAEMDNALNNVMREVKQRYDFKDSISSVERGGAAVTIHADDEMKLTALHEMLAQHMSRRGLDVRSLVYAQPERASGDTLRQRATVRQGIDADLARTLVKAVKATKLKVQVAVQGEELRVNGKKRDDLQDVIALIKEMKDVDVPLQYVNFRE